uniref:Arginine/serine-rich protein PNISR n=1 Tax=Anisakis simplex TaxID=6269 RepID=A0A0M3KFD2_ANISI
LNEWIEQLSDTQADTDEEERSPSESTGSESLDSSSASDRDVPKRRRSAKRRRRSKRRHKKTDRSTEERKEAETSHQKNEPARKQMIEDIIDKLRNGEESGSSPKSSTPMEEQAPKPEQAPLPSRQVTSPSQPANQTSPSAPNAIAYQNQPQPQPIYYQQPAAVPYAIPPVQAQAHSPVLWTGVPPTPNRNEQRSTIISFHSADFSRKKVDFFSNFLNNVEFSASKSMQSILWSNNKMQS